VGAQGDLAGLALVAPPLRVAQIQLPVGLTCPVLIVAGAEDQYCPPTALEAIRAGLPVATVVVIEGADHFFLGSLAPLGDAVGAWADALQAA
jgi:pimeloyl-ACP methyl ester carboxylesterase